METILLNEYDPEEEICKKLLSWNSDFSMILLDRLTLYGWKEKYDNKTHYNYIVAPETDWIIKVYRSRKPFIYGVGLFNPFYEIYFKGLCVCHVCVEVQRYSTLYSVSWNEPNLERVFEWFKNEKPVFNNLSSHNIWLKPVEFFLVGY